VTSLNTGELRCHQPRQGALAEGSSLVVGGSDCGVIHLFERRSGMAVGELQHAEGGLVQTIAVGEFLRKRDVGADIMQAHDGDGWSCIAAASSNRSDDITITMWTRQKKRPKAIPEHRRLRGQVSICKTFRLLLQIGMLYVLAMWLRNALSKASLEK